MLKSTLILLLLFVSFYGTSQEIDKRLLPRYSKKELISLQKTDPEEYTFLVNALNKGVVISEIPAVKANSIVFDGTLDINPNKTHTFISLDKEITNSYQYYKIAGTTKMLTIHPRISLDPRELKKIKNK